MTLTTKYFEQAQLSMAAYASLQRAMFGKNYPGYVAALMKEGMSQSQAAVFADTYMVVDQYTDSLTGLSATVFSDAEGAKYFSVRGTEPGSPFDWLNDISIFTGLLGTVLPSQYAALENYYQQLIAEGLLGENDTVTVSGHSLGGFLAQLFAVDHATVVTHAYTYNAPGIGGFVGQLGELFGITSPNISSTAITNVQATGPSATAGWGTLLGDVRTVYIEEQAPNLLENHSIAHLTDALAVYTLLNRLNPSLSLSALTPIVQAGSNQPASSLENIVNALGDLLGLGSTVITDNRDQLYARIQAIRNGLPAQPPFALTSLVNLAPEAIAGAASADKGFIYALETLIPFAVVGDNSLYGSINANDYTPEYLLDRATLLEDKMIRAVSDYPLSGVGTEFNGVGPYAAQFLHLIDDASNYDARKFNGVPPDAELTLRFGRDDAVSGDTLVGAIGKDHLYGRGGDDTLEGGADDDYLEGGKGNDTYIFNVGDGIDTIFDSDGIGTIHIVSTTGDTIISGVMDSVPGANNLYEDDEGNRYTKQGDNLIISVKDDGGQITVKNFTDGVLGIERSTVQAPVPQQVPSGIQTFTLGQIGKYAEVYSPTVYAPTVHPIYGAIDSHLLTEVIQATGATPPLVGSGNGNVFITGEVYGGLGDSYIVGDAGFNYLVDDLIQVVLDFDNAPVLNPDLPVQWLLAYPDIFQTLEANQQDLVFFNLGDQVGDDVLKGGAGNDWLVSHGGDDWLYGDDGNDTLIDNPGLDFGDNRWLALAGASSDDHLFGGAGNDTAFTLQGEDYLDGGDDNDILLSGQNDDILLGGKGDDWLLADAALKREEFLVESDGSYNHILEAADDTEAYGKDTLFGDAGNDMLAGGRGDDWLQGGTENDTLWGDGTSTFNNEIGELSVAVGDGSVSGNDKLFGEKGDDTLIGGGGDDYLDGGDGDDTLTGDHEALDIAYHGNDHLAGGEGDDTLFGNGGDDTLSGDAGNDQLVGDEGNDTLFGGDGNDALSGRDGDDILSGGDGDDVLIGGDGSDGLFGDAGADRFDGGEGDDTVSGGAGNDELYGSAGNDVLEGGGGTDLLFGGDGNDIYHVSPGGGQDVIVDTQGTNSISFGAGISLDSLGFQELQASDGAYYLSIDTGASGDRVLIKNAPLGTISNVSFSDGTVVSLAGVLAHANIPLRTFGSDGDDSIQGGTAADVFQGGGGNDLMWGADGADVLNGGEGQDILQGGAGNDALDGGIGNDELRGGSGRDSYFLGWGMGRDTLIEANGENSVLQLDAGISLSDLVLSRNGNDLLVQLGRAGDSLLVKDYTSGNQRLTLRTDGGLGTVIDDNLINSAQPAAVHNSATAVDRYLTTASSIFNSTRGDNGSVAGSDGVLRRTTSIAASAGAYTEYFSEQLKIVDQYSDGSYISRESSPVYESVRLQTGQGTASSAAINTNVAQQILDTTGATFSPAAGTGTEIPAGAAIVSVFGRPEDADGNVDAATNGYSQKLGYWVFPSGLGGVQTPGLQLNTIPNNTYETNSVLTLERITAGPSDNIITTTGYSIVDAGAGNDTVTASFNLDWRYNQEFYVSPYTFDRPHDRRNVGALLDGNTGDDNLSGGDANDILIGGDGNDFLNGASGGDTYVITAGDTGWDTIEDSGSLVWHPETFSTRYQDWYYQSLSIDDWKEREERGESLPPLPVVPINDYLSIEQLAAKGVIATDTIEFGDGINLADLTLSWGEYVPYAKAQDGPSPLSQVNFGPHEWMDAGSVHTTLDISWNAGSGVRVVMPHAAPLDNKVSPTVLDYAPNLDLTRFDWFLGTGIEAFKFSDGAELSMRDMLAMAPTAPTLDPHLLDNTLEGTVAADKLIGSLGNDLLRGGAGNDVYVFNAGDGIDTIEDASFAGDANTILFGAGISLGDLALSWTATGLTIQIGSSGDAINLISADPTNNDPSQVIKTLSFSTNENLGGPGVSTVPLVDLLPSGGSGEIPGIHVVGTTGYDTLTGTVGKDVIEAFSGNDIVYAGGGNDLIDGGGGRDTLNGEGGDDTFVVTGSDSAYDIFNGGGGRDTILGGDGDDTIRLRSFGGNSCIEAIDGGGGVNVIAGTSGYDTIDLSATTLTNIDRIDGGSGNDTITGTGDNNVIIGGAGRDILNGEGGDDTFIVAGTDSAYDTFNGGSGVDTILGGDGNDTIRLRSFTASSSIESIDGGGGVNVIAGTGGYDTIDLSATTLTNIDRIDGGSGNDTITGTEDNDVIIGGPGRDVLNGGGGDDTFIVAGTDSAYDAFDGGAGVDTILGGDGNDTIRLRSFGASSGIEAIDGGAGFNVIAGSSGYDTIDLSLTTITNIDRIDGGSGNDTITGTEDNDVIIGGPGRDVLNGGGGDDTFIVAGTDSDYDAFDGGAGVDTILGGDGDDIIRLRSFGAASGIEAIDGGAGINMIAGTSGYDTIDLSATTVTNVDRIDAGSGNDVVTGTDAGDVIKGGAGTDTLNGGLGDDLYLFNRNDGHDQLIDLDGGVNNDSVQFGSGIRHDQLWFSPAGNDLNIAVIGTNDAVTIDNWYLGTDRQIESLRSGDGFTLLNTQVDQLVQAMAAFSPPVSGEIDLPPDLQTQLEPVLAQSWQTG